MLSSLQSEGFRSPKDPCSNHIGLRKEKQGMIRARARTNPFAAERVAPLKEFAEDQGRSFERTPQCRGQDSKASGGTTRLWLRFAFVVAMYLKTLCVAGWKGACLHSPASWSSMWHRSSFCIRSSSVHESACAASPPDILLCPILLHRGRNRLVLAPSPEHRSSFLSWRFESCFLSGSLDPPKEPGCNCWVDQWNPIGAGPGPSHTPAVSDFEGQDRV